MRHVLTVAMVLLIALIAPTQAAIPHARHPPPVRATPSPRRVTPSRRAAPTRTPRLTSIPISPPTLAPSPTPTASPTPDAQAELQRVNAEVTRLYEKGDYAGVLKALNQELALCKHIQEPGCEDSVLGDIAYVYDDMGQYTLALDFYKRTAALKHARGDRAGEAVTLNNIGLVYRRLAQYTNALSTSEQALALWHVLKDESGEGTTLNNIGSIYLSLSEYSRALEMYQQALVLKRKVDDRVNVGHTLNNIGLVHQSVGHYPQALSFYEQSLSIAREVTDTQAQAIVLSNIGVLYFGMGQYPKALGYFNQDLVLSRSSGNPLNEATTLNNMAATYDNMGDSTRAITLYEQALSVTQKMGDRASTAAALGNLGLAYDNVGQPTKAISLLQQSLTLARQIGDRHSEGTALSNLATAYYDLGQYAQALQLYPQALAILNELGDPTSQGKVLRDIGRTYEAQGHLDQALDAYMQSVNMQESLRQSSSVEEFKISLAEQAADVYARATLLLTRMGRNGDAFNLSERARARTFLDQMGNARIDARAGADAQLVQQEQDVRLELAALQRELSQQRALPQAQQNLEVLRSINSQIAAKQAAYTDLLTHLQLSNPEYASLVSVAPMTLTDTQQLLDGNTTLLDYFVTPTRTLAFILTRDQFETVPLTVSQAELTAAISQFRRFDDLSDPAPPSLRQLSDWLLAPVQPYLRTSVIGIIPHGVLHYLPFAALPDPSAKTAVSYFGSRNTLFYLPSLSVLRYVQGKHKNGLHDALALAMPNPPGFDALHYANQEANAIAALFGTQAVVGQNATETEFDQHAGQHPIVHVAAHGEYNPAHSLFSRIVLAPDAQQDGSLEVHEVYGLDLKNTDLVVLSACDTQLGKQSKGDDIIGLNRAFLYAGAPTLVASLWSVNDEATSVLMQAFYMHLKAGMGKADALRAAQADTRARFPNPYYWAAFVLTGDPGTVTTAPLLPTWVLPVVLVALIVAAIAAVVWWRRRAQRRKTSSPLAH